MTVDANLNQLAAKQGGVVTRAQALRAGLTRNQISWRLEKGQWLTHSYGAYRLFNVDHRLAAVQAALAVLPNAVASHNTACHLHGIDRLPPGPLCVSVHTQTTHQFPGVRVIRSHDILSHHTTIASEIKVTTVARTVLDLAAHLTIGRLAAVVDSAFSKDLATADDLYAVIGEVARRGKPGIRNLKAILGERDGQDPTGSVLEIRGRRVLTERGITGFETEYAIPWSPQQRFDVAFPSHRLALEWDSRTWHAIQSAFESDRLRDRAAVVNGWRVLRFTWSDVHEHPDVVVATIERAMR